MDLGPGKVLLRESPGDQQCLQQLHPPDKGVWTVYLPPGLCPGEGSMKLWCSACRGCRAGTAAPGSQREQRPWRAGTGRDPRESASLLTRTRLSQGCQDEHFSRGDPGVVSRGVMEQNGKFLGCWPKGKFHSRSNRRLMPLLVEGWVWSLSYIGKLKSKKKFQNHKGRHDER